MIMSEDRIDQKRADDRYYRDKLENKKRIIKAEQHKMSEKLASFDRIVKNRTEKSQKVAQEIKAGLSKSKSTQYKTNQENITRKAILSQGRKQTQEEEKLLQEERSAFYKKYNINTKSEDDRDDALSILREKNLAFNRKDQDKIFESKRRDVEDLNLKEEKLEDLEDEPLIEDGFSQKASIKNETPNQDYRIVYYQGGGQEKEKQNQSENQDDDQDSESSTYDDEELVDAVKNPHQIEKMKIASVKSSHRHQSSGEQRFTLSSELIESMVDMMMLNIDEDGEKVLEVQLSDKYYDGVKLRFTPVNRVIELTIVCPNSRVKNTFLMNRSSLMVNLEKKNIKITKINVI